MNRDRHGPAAANSTNTRPALVRVAAPARLHLGFVDVSGSLGRRFGSLGLTLEDLATVVELRRSDSLRPVGPTAWRCA